MASIIKLYLLAVLVIAEILPLNVFSQNQLINSLDTTKTVAIYSSKNSFFTDYPIETLVSHLNSLNTNPTITYYKSTEDHSKTGFYADYLIDLNVWMKMPSLDAPKMETIQHRTTIVIARRDGSRQTQEIITTEERGMATPVSRPGQGEIRIKVIEKRKNEKVTRTTLVASNNKEQGLKLVLIIQLIEFLLRNFSN